MKIIYIVGEDGAGKTTLTSIIAYNLFLRNYQVAILDLTEKGRGYHFRFGTCDFFALGDGGVEIPKRLLVTLQDISGLIQDNPQAGLHSLPFMPGLKLCLSASSPREEKINLAGSFIESCGKYFDFVFIEMEPPLQLPSGPVRECNYGVVAVCAGAEDEWPGKDEELAAASSGAERVKVLLNKQGDKLAAATRFVKKNGLGVDYILPCERDILTNSTVMEMCKKMARSAFLQNILSVIYGIMRQGMVDNR